MIKTNWTQLDHKLWGLGLFICLFLVGGVSNRLQADKIANRFEDVVTLANEYVYLSMSPRIGRVVAFGRIGQESIIWMAPKKQVDKAIDLGRWRNDGGDKVWPNVQSQWLEIYGRRWPPDRVIDSQPWQIIDQSSDSVTIQSRVSEKQSLQIRRTFELLPGQPRVQIQNTITQWADTFYPVHVWSVTQIKPPNHVLLHVLNPDPNNEPCKYYVWIGKSKTARKKPRWLPDISAMYYDQTVSQSGKIGTLGQWIQAVYSTQIFRQTHILDTNAYYPEQASVECYVGKGYVEMETLSPARVLKVGQSLKHTVVWELLTVNDKR